MKDLSALASKLAAVCADDESYEDGARIISQAGVPAPLTALLAAIDDTVLERKLEVLAGSHLISVIAADRRLRGISSIVPTPEGSAAIIGTPISREDSQTVEALRETLDALLEPAKRLTLRSLPGEPFGKSGERGVLASELIDLWNVEKDLTPLAGIAGFLRANQDRISAHLYVKGPELVSKMGQDDQLEQIWDLQVADVLNNRRSLSGNDEGPQLMMMRGCLADGGNVALASAGEELVLFAFEGDDMAKLHASWRAVVA